LTALFLEVTVRIAWFRNFVWLLLSLVPVMTMVSQPASAQDVFGRISGTVTDPSAAVVPKAKVTITNQATNVTRTAETDETGFYVVPNVIAGTYEVAVEHSGFKTTTKTGNVLVAGGRLTVDVGLTLGQTSENMTVEAVGETVNTVSGEVARTIDSKQVQNLALNTRNYMQLVSLIPGVALTTDDQLGMSTNMAINNQAVNGNRADQNLVTVDGGFNMDSGSNASQINNVGIDFVQEVSVKSSNFSAEYGRNAGASINVVTRSGGDRFHGGAFEYIRNDIFDAINPASKLNAVPGTPISKLKAPLRFNDFGWDLGGPLVKSKLFFFIGEEWKRIRQLAPPQNLTVPTTAEMNGDFSVLLAAVQGIPACSCICQDSRAFQFLETSFPMGG
jgi:Carboxypeptidase regulatory-like domain/TonB-dependent Receptor Plug Domain